MRRSFYCLPLAALAAVLSAGAARADDYGIDPVHSSVTFKAGHLGLAWIHGRFNAFSGGFTVDKDAPEKCSFTLTVKAESVDTNNAQRDKHLKSPDFFNVKQFPQITFKSTAVKADKGGYEVTGDLTLHGQTKPVTFTLKGGREAQFPPGTRRTGFSAELTLKRGDFGMDKLRQAISDDVPVSISFEGTRK